MRRPPANLMRRSGRFPALPYPAASVKQLHCTTPSMGMSTLLLCYVTDCPRCGEQSTEIYYFDDDGNPADEEEATRCVIRECDKDGNLLNEIWGTV